MFYKNSKHGPSRHGPTGNFPREIGSCDPRVLRAVKLCNVPETQTNVQNLREVWLEKNSPTSVNILLSCFSWWHPCILRYRPYRPINIMWRMYCVPIVQSAHTQNWSLKCVSWQPTKTCIFGRSCKVSLTRWSLFYILKQFEFRCRVSLPGRSSRQDFEENMSKCSYLAKGKYRSCPFGTNT